MIGGRQRKCSVSMTTPGNFWKAMSYRLLSGSNRVRYLGISRQVLVEQVEYLLPVQADVFWAGLLVVADHDGLFGQGQQRQRFQTDLGCLVDDEDVEGRVSLRAEAGERPRGRHDPHRDGVLGLVQRGPDLRQPALRELAAGPAEPGHGPDVAVERLPLPVPEVVGQAAPGPLADEFGDHAPAFPGQLFELGLQLGRRRPGESGAYPGVQLPPLPGDGQSRRDRRHTAGSARIRAVQIGALADSRCRSRAAGRGRGDFVQVSELLAATPPLLKVRLRERVRQQTPQR